MLNRTFRQEQAAVFNKDIDNIGSYVYSGKNIYSAFVVQSRISREINNLLGKSRMGKQRIIDVGCGDGKYTLEVFNFLKPRYLLGIDPAKRAIHLAKSKVSKDLRKRIAFQVSAIEDRTPRKNRYDLAIARAVLHHIEKPEIAVKRLCSLTNAALVLEPNGLNPFIKLFEKLVPYHRRHKEKSYFPYEIDKWFKENRFELVERKVFNITPVFSPTLLVKMLKPIEPVVERIPILKYFFCSQYVALYQRQQ